MANITAISKMSDKSDPGNYRPIGLTSVINKILESIVREYNETHGKQQPIQQKSVWLLTREVDCSAIDTSIRYVD